MQRFIQFASTLAAAAALSATAQTPSPASEPATNSAARGGFGRRGFNAPADQPAPRRDSNSETAHQQLIEKAKKGGIDVYFVGDSITRRWGASDPQYHANLENWNTNFFG